MEEVAVRKRLEELCEVLTAVPSAGLKQKPGEGVYLPLKTPQNESVDCSFDNLRLHIRYLMFDVEATRRENRYLRQMLENRHKHRGEDSKGDQGGF